MSSDDQTFTDSVNRAVKVIATAIQPVTPFIDKNPKGLDAVVVAAALRAYADVIESEFGEGNNMGPLKTAVDGIRQRLLQEFMKRGG